MVYLCTLLQRGHGGRVLRQSGGRECWCSPCFLHFIQCGTSARGMVLHIFRLHYPALVPLSGDNFTDKPRCASQLFKFIVKISHDESIEFSVVRGNVAGRSQLGPLTYISVEQEADMTLSVPSFVLCHSGFLGSHQNNALSSALR